MAPMTESPAVRALLAALPATATLLIDPKRITLGLREAVQDTVARLHGAYDIITDTNLLPSVCGRVCPQ